MRPQTARKSLGWKAHIRTLSQCRLRGGAVLLNPQIIHGFFGKPEQQQGVIVYCLKRMTETGQNANVVVSGAKFDQLNTAFESMKNAEVDRLWYYLAEKKYILYIEEKHAVCIDYGRFKAGETVIIEMLDLRGGSPLKDFIVLDFAIKEADRLINWVLGERDKVELQVREELDADEGNFEASRCCQYCRVVAEKTLMPCIRCQSVYYCDRSCQGKDLPNHMKSCIKLEVKAVQDN